MAHIDALVNKVTDPALRAALREQVDSLLSKRSFGLVFQEHRPETVEQPQHRVRRGCKVRVWDEPDQVLYRVDKLHGDEASVTSLTEPPVQRRLLRSDLVVVREFGDPVYPGLVRTGRVNRGGDKAAHVVINAENFYALETLLYTHEGKVDAIYIDPPYNTRDKDWKYNNDYVDSSDIYSHSKWLAMMQRRLRLAAKLLNPERSTLIVTIDENEVHRLGLLLEQIFPDAVIDMVTVVMSAKGAVRRGRFSRVEEYLFFVLLGEAAVTPHSSNMLPSYREEQQEADLRPEDAEEDPPAAIEWLGLRRREPSSVRGSRPNQFYPIFVYSDSGGLHSVGDAVEDDVDRHGVPVPAGTVTLWPLKPDGSEMLWGLTPEVLRRNWAKGYARVNWKKSTQKGTVYYLPSGTIARIGRGEITVTGRASDGSVQGYLATNALSTTPPKRVWNTTSHNAETGGTSMLTALVPRRHFPYPKSLYAVEDALRFVVGQSKDALVLDFFAGSGTTLHAVARLNKQDGGRRRCICVTNNEVSEQEALALTAQGYRPGDDAWEGLGICEYVTKPRVLAALTGETHLGEPVAGTYKFTDQFPMSQGLKENAEFFSLTYEDPDLISLGKKFEAIAPLLWLKAGGHGAILETVVEPWALAPDAHYALLFDTDQWREFVDEVGKRDDLTHIFIVTDSEATFQQVTGELPRGLGCTQLYEDYLHNFQINTRGRR